MRSNPVHLTSVTLTSPTSLSELPKYWPRFPSLSAVSFNARLASRCRATPQSLEDRLKEALNPSDVPSGILVTEAVLSTFATLPDDAYPHSPSGLEEMFDVIFSLEQLQHLTSLAFSGYSASLINPTFAGLVKLRSLKIDLCDNNPDAKRFRDAYDLQAQMTQLTLLTALTALELRVGHEAGLLLSALSLPSSLHTLKLMEGVVVNVSAPSQIIPHCYQPWILRTTTSTSGTAKL
jgi:hypothetical protein